MSLLEESLLNKGIVFVVFALMQGFLKLGDSPKMGENPKKGLLAFESWVKLKIFTR